MKLQKKKAKQKVNPKEILKSRVEEKLEDEGVIFFMPDVNLDIDPESLRLPQDITEVSTKELGQYLNAFTQQKVYMRTLKGWAESNLRIATLNYQESTRDIYRELSDKKWSEKAKERELVTNPDVRESYNKMTEAQEECHLIQYSIDNIEDIIFMISREVSRRTGDFNEENRSYNVSKR